MIDVAKAEHQQDLELVEQVDFLSDEVKTLALNLAIYLAKVKAAARTEAINKMEPEFVKLVNGTVKVVQEMTLILNAARNMERMIYDVPSGQMEQDSMEVRLRGILGQCETILGSLRDAKEIRRS
ncbi:MAG: hypothetical protein WAU88_04480 [Candidatus Zixiibacteriota bacterium]|jgi:hypothetical protein